MKNNVLNTIRDFKNYDPQPRITVCYVVTIVKFSSKRFLKPLKIQVKRINSVRLIGQRLEDRTNKKHKL